VDRVIKAASIGANFTTLAACAGVSRETFVRWRKQGAADLDAGRDTTLAKMVLGLRKARSEDAVRCLAQITKAAQSGDVNAARWKLERIHGYGPDGPEPDPDADVSIDSAPMDRDTLVASLAALPPDVLTDALAKAGG
jgi:hypothetical protein